MPSVPPLPREIGLIAGPLNRQPVTTPSGTSARADLTDPGGFLNILWQDDLRLWRLYGAESPGGTELSAGLTITGRGSTWWFAVHNAQPGPMPHEREASLSTADPHVTFLHLAVAAHPDNHPGREDTYLLKAFTAWTAERSIPAPDGDLPDLQVQAALAGLRL